MKFFATVILFFSFTTASKAEISTQIVENEYSFTANNLPEMLVQVQRHGPKVKGLDTWASLQSEIDAEYKVVNDNDGCQFYQPKVEVRAVMTLPNWQNIAILENEIHQWWRGYINYLSEHELVHLSIVKQAAQKLLTKLSQKHQGYNCSALRKRYFSYKVEMLTEIRAQDAEFDRNSNSELVNNKSLFALLSPHMNNKIEFKKPVAKLTFHENFSGFLGSALTH
ncbi:MAG: DUF922 domain-containing protein [Psychrobium sp.]